MLHAGVVKAKLALCRWRTHHRKTPDKRDKHHGGPGNREVFAITSGFFAAKVVEVIPKYEAGNYEHGEHFGAEARGYLPSQKVVQKRDDVAHNNRAGDKKRQKRQPFPNPELPLLGVFGVILVEYIR